MNGYSNPLGQPCTNCQQNQQYAVNPLQSTTGDQVFPAVPGTTQPPSVSPYLPSAPAQQQPGLFSPITHLTQPMPVTTESMQYINGYLRAYIGRKVTVQFLIGTNSFVDKTGTLLGVGANYILINELETDDITICDFYTIKFVRIYG